MPNPHPSVRRQRGAVRHPILLSVGLVLLALVVFAFVTDWGFLRGPVERFVSQKTQREFHMSALHVRLGLHPTIRMSDVVLGNAPWSGERTPMARVGDVEVTLSLRDALAGKLLIPRVAVRHADLLLEKSQNRRNWLFTEPTAKTSESPLRLGALAVDDVRMRFIDRDLPFELRVQGHTFDPKAAAAANDAKAPPSNVNYTTRFAFEGRYRDAGFSGEAFTGDVVSLTQSGIPFPVKGNLVAGTTKLQVEGTVADAANLSAIDARIAIEGQTLANLYPFLLLPLPASPPYQLTGHLKLNGQRYGMEELQGRIGETDIAGRAEYVADRQPRPLLTAQLHSKLLNITDLGPLVGVTTKSTEGGAGAATKATQASTSTREQAKQKEQQQTGGKRVLPAGTADANRRLPGGRFEGERLQAIDADVDYRADRWKAPSALPIESLDASVHLHDGVLRAKPLDIGFAGGNIAGDVRLDATKKTLYSTIGVDAKQIRIDRLVPKDSPIAKGAGLVGAQMRLKGAGNSIADLAAAADGSISAVVGRGRISNLLDAAAGLNGGKVLQVLASGDKEIAVNCGGIAFDVQRGIAHSTVFRIDTEQTQIGGEGTINLRDERFDITIAPEPKKAGILSLRTPIRLYGTFAEPDFELKKQPLLLRLGGAVALAAVAPLAALLPLVETGPGEETNCAALKGDVAATEQKAGNAGSKPGTADRNKEAPPQPRR